MKEPVTLENYNIKREKIITRNANLLGIVLNGKEQRLDARLAALKKEYRNSCGGKVPYHVPVLTDQALVGSRLYRFCSMLPKGADLHVHDLSLLPWKEQIELLSERDEFYINTDKIHYDLIRVDAEKEVPKGYCRFRDAMAQGLVTEEELRTEWTILGAEAKNINVWDWFEELFVRHAVLSDYPAFAEAYYRKTFRYYIEHGIYHVEIHLLMLGKAEDSVEYIKTVRRIYYEVKRENPIFHVKIIGAGLKADNEHQDASRECFLNTVYAQEQVKDDFDPEHITDFVIGYDLINEEDGNLPLKDFAPMLLQAKEKYPDMHLYMHGGESLSAENENLVDAYLLGVSRVGHGLNLYRYPGLLERYARSEICLEVCVISNQTLGYTRDVRSHPAVEYLRRGVAVALCSDDPVYQEHETLTDDFFAATLCWNLDLADLKQLGINSIMYSGLDSREKTELLRAYRERWNNFVDEALKLF